MAENSYSSASGSYEEITWFSICSAKERGEGGDSVPEAVEVEVDGGYKEEEVVEKRVPTEFIESLTLLRMFSGREKAEGGGRAVVSMRLRPAACIEAFC